MNFKIIHFNKKVFPPSKTLLIPVGNNSMGYNEGQGNTRNYFTMCKLKFIIESKSKKIRSCALF